MGRDSSRLRTQGLTVRVLLRAAYFRSSYRTYTSLPPKKQASGHSTDRGVLARYLALCLDEKLAKASCAETDIS